MDPIAAAAAACVGAAVTAALHFTVPYLRKRNGNGKLHTTLQLQSVVEELREKQQNKSGDRSVEEWEGRMRKMHQEAEERLMDNISNLMQTREYQLVEKITEKVTKPIVEELKGLRDDLTKRSIFIRRDDSDYPPYPGPERRRGGT